MQLIWNTGLYTCISSWIKSDFQCCCPSFSFKGEGTKGMGDQHSSKWENCLRGKNDEMSAVDDTKRNQTKKNNPNTIITIITN